MSDKNKTSHNSENQETLPENSHQCKVGDKFKITFMGVTKYRIVTHVDLNGIITTKAYILIGSPNKS